MPLHGTSPQAKAATASAPATVTVGVTSTELIEAHDWRRSYAVQNTHDRNIVYLGFEHDATTDGIQLLPGQVWSDEDFRSLGITDQTLILALDHAGANPIGLSSVAGALTWTEVR